MAQSLIHMEELTIKCKTKIKLSFRENLLFKNYLNLDKC